MSESETVLHFWFGTAESAIDISQRQEALWWRGAADTDAEIGRRFGELRQRAIAGELDDWRGSARGRLAAIILVDQFSRNLHRGHPDAFAQDALARRWCLDAISQQADQALRPIERVFVYLPLEHSESREDQAQSVRLFERLVREVPTEEQSLFEFYAGYARAHRDVIERFGRFPHRNVILGRPSTAEELAFLRQPGSSF